MDKSTRTPPGHPDAVTLAPHPSVPELLTRIDTSVGCSIKDSFASLDMNAYGFQVLFDAQWIVHRAPASSPSPDAVRWEVVRDGVGLAAWEQAWRGDDGPPGSTFVGYESDNELVAARTHGFETVGPLPGLDPRRLSGSCRSPSLGSADHL
jgi:hypothetical protein